MMMQPTPRREFWATRWSYWFGFLGLLLGGGTADAGPPAMLASKLPSLVLPAWSLDGLWDKVSSLSSDRLIQVGIIVMCLALFFITRGKWR